MVAFEDGISLYNPRTGRRASAAAGGTVNEYEQLPGTRLNDGRYVLSCGVAWSGVAWCGVVLSGVGWRETCTLT